MAAPAGFTTVSAAALQDASGNLVATATIRFVPSNNAGEPISFRAGSPAEGQVIDTEVTAEVVNGAFTIVLADTTLTTPINVGYSVTLIDNITGDSLLGPGYGCVQPSGSTWSFDTYVVSGVPGALVLPGPVGINFRGTWAPGTVYQTRDSFLSPDGSLYYVSGLPFTSGSSFVVNASMTLFLSPNATAGARLDALIRNLREPSNLFDPATITPAMAIEATAGNAVAASAAFYVSDFIVASHVSAIYINQNSGADSNYGWAWYDKNKAMISLSNQVGSDVHIEPFFFYRPDAAVYFRMFGDYARISTMIVRDADQSGLPPTTNLFTNQNTHPGAFNINGTVNPDSNWTVTDFMLVYKIGAFRSSLSSGGPGTGVLYGWIFYDANKNFLGNVPPPSRPDDVISVTPESVYMRAYALTSQISTLQIIRCTPGVQFHDAYRRRSSRWLGENYACVGDSITYNGSALANAYNGYQRPVRDALGMNLVIDNGISGMKMTDILSLINYTQVTNATTIPGIALCTVFMGTNDFGNPPVTPLGTMADTTSSTFYGAVDQIINTYLGWNPSLRLAFLTPLPRVGQDTPNAQGHILADYVGALVLKCKQYSIPCLNLFEQSGLNVKTFGTLLQDGLHPNNAGYDACITPLLIDFLAGL